MVVHGLRSEPCAAVSADAGATMIAAVASAAASTFRLIVMAAGSHSERVMSFAAATPGPSTRDIQASLRSVGRRGIDPIVSYPAPPATPSVTHASPVPKYPRHKVAPFVPP